MADGKVVIETDLDSSGIEKGIKNTQKSLKAQAASLAAVYRKQGMSASEALKKAWGDIERDSKTTTDTVEKNWDKSFEQLKNIAKRGLEVIRKAVTVTATSLVAVGTAATIVGSNFEEGMSKVAAISGATGADFEKLKEKAKQMGATTKFSATEAASAFEYMAMAGWKTTDMLGGIDGVMNLAAASGEDLALVSDIVTDAITAFGLSASDSGHFADVLAAASSNANTNVSMLGESFKYVAPIAGAMKYSVEDTSLALGLMANASIKGSMAGTSLKTSLANLASPTDSMAEVMEKYGISLTDADGSMKSLREVIDTLRSKMGGLDEATQTAAASTLFGKEAMAGMLAIINASEADYNKLASAVNNADGTAKNMADTMQDNLKGSITILKSSLEGLGIQIYESMETPLKNAANAGIKSVERISGAFKRGGLSGAVKEAGKMIDEFTDNLAESSKVAGDIINPLKNVTKQAFNLGKTALPSLVKVLRTTIKNMDILVPIVVAGYTALKAHTAITAAHVAVTKTIAAATTLWKNAQEALNIAVTKNPIGLVVTVLGTLVAGIGAYNLITGEAIDATSGLSEEQKKIIKNSKDAIENLKQEAAARQENLKSATAEMDASEALWSELQKCVDANGRVKSGYEARAQYISGELASALGVEIGLVDGIIQNYEDLDKSIKDVIASKKANAMVEAMDSDYTSAMKEQCELASQLVNDYNKLRESKDRNAKITEEMAELEHDLATVTTHTGEEIKIHTKRYYDLSKELDRVTAEVETNQAAFDASSAAMKDNEKVISDYNLILEAAMSGSTETINSALAEIQSGIDTSLQASSEAAYKQTEEISKTLLELLQGQEEGIVDLQQSVIDNTAQSMGIALNTMSDSSENMKKMLENAGAEGSSRMIAAMASANLSGNLSLEAQAGMEGFIAGFSGLDIETKEVWSQAWYGALEGLKGFEDLADPAKEGVDVFLESLREALDVNSPSRKVMDIFSYVWPGAEKGLDEGKDSVIEKAQTFIQEFLARFETSELNNNMSQTGINIMTSFAQGISSQTGNSQAAGTANALAANAGAASVVPTTEGKTWGFSFGSGITNAASTVSKAGLAAATAAKTGASTVNPTQVGSKFSTDLSSGMLSQSGTISNSGKKLAESAKKSAGGVNPSSTGKTFGSTYAAAVSGMQASAQAAGAAIASAANGLHGLASVSAHQAGANFGTGFGGGIRSAIGSAVNAAASLAQNALAAIKNKLDIHSPSRETTKLGEFTGEGMPIGIRKKIPEARKASDEMSDAILEGLDVEYQLGRMRAAMNMEKMVIGSNMTMKVVHEYTMENKGEIQKLSDMISNMKLRMAKEDIASLAREFAVITADNLEGMGMTCYEREFARVVRRAAET